MRKKVGIIKRLFSLLLIFLLSINSFAAIVSDNDGSAFITKAEFDALKSSFQSQIDSYNQSIDSKIDGAIASYLAGIKLSSQVQATSNFVENFNCPCTFWRSDVNNELASNQVVSGKLTNSIPVEIIAFEVYGQKNGATEPKQTGGLGTLQFFGKSYNHNIRAGWTGTYDTTTKMWDISGEANNWSCSYRVAMTYSAHMGWQGYGKWRFNTYFSSKTDVEFDMSLSQNITTGIFSRTKKWANEAGDATRYNDMALATWDTRGSYGGSWGESASQTIPKIASYEEVATWSNKFSHLFTNSTLYMVNRLQNKPGIYDTYCGKEHKCNMTIWNSANMGVYSGGLSDHTYDVEYLHCWPQILKPKYTADSAKSTALPPNKAQYTIDVNGTSKTFDFMSAPLLWVAPKDTEGFSFTFEIDASSTCTSATIDFGKTTWKGTDTQDCTDRLPWGLNTATLTTGAKTISKGNTYTANIDAISKDETVYFRIVPNTGNCILKNISEITYIVPQ